MKTIPRSFLILITLLTACATPITATLFPTPVFTNTPPATATLKPTQTLKSTATHIPLSEISLDSCAKIVNTKISNADVLEVIYISGNAHSIATSKFGFGSDTEHARLWLWSEDTQTATPFPLPSDALGPKLSSNYQWIIFRRDSGAIQSELWMMDIKSQNEQKLATIPFDESSGLDAILNYGWVPNTNKMYYFVDLVGGGGELEVHNIFGLVDVDSGQAIPLVKPGEVSNVIFALDGSQAAIQTASGLQLISTKDGNVRFTLPIPLGSFGTERASSLAYSPDGKYLIEFIGDGILRINTVDGQWQVIPLLYTLIFSPGGDNSPSQSPEFTWIGNSNFFLPVWTQHIVISTVESDPGASSNTVVYDPTFAVWQVDLAGGAAQLTQTFTGFPFPVYFSPDGKRLAFQKLQGTAPIQTTELFIADLTTGGILATIADGQFEVWSPESNRYIYSTGHTKNKGETNHAKYYLGELGKEPILLHWSTSDSVSWVDAERVITDCKIIHLP